MAASVRAIKARTALTWTRKPAASRPMAAMTMLMLACMTRLPVRSERLPQKYTKTAAMVYGMATMKPTSVVVNRPSAATMVGIHRPRP